MSKSGKTKYRWYDEEDDRRDRRRDKKHRQEKRMKNAIKSRDIDKLGRSDYYDWHYADSDD